MFPCPIPAPLASLFCMSATKCIADTRCKHTANEFKCLNQSYPGCPAGTRIPGEIR